MIVAIIVSLLAGCAIVLSRTVNAKLALETSLITSTFYNFLIGFVVSLMALLLLGRKELNLLPVSISTKGWIYIGGIVGILVVLILNYTVTNIPAFYMTLLIFTGQLFTGIILDVLISHSFSAKQMLGGAFVAFGLSVNLYIDRRESQKMKKR